MTDSLREYVEKVKAAKVEMQCALIDIEELIVGLECGYTAMGLEAQQKVEQHFSGNYRSLMFSFPNFPEPEEEEELLPDPGAKEDDDDFEEDFMNEDEE